MKFSCWRSVVTLAVALFCVRAASDEMTSSLRFDEAAAKGRPVSKVITLLKDMLHQLEKEAQDDEDVYDKVACWCETNEKEKTKAIAEAEAKISSLTSKIEDLTASSAELNTEIKNLEREVASNQEALDQATALRKKQLAEFNAEEKDLLESISALKSAVTVLSKHHGGFLLQFPHDRMQSVASTLKKEVTKHAARLHGVLTPSDQRAVQSFIQSPQDYFSSSPTFKQAYAPQSGEIYGILRQMQETFEANLADAQKEESADQKAYEDLKAAKQAEISAGQEQVDKKTQELADTDEKLARAKEDLTDTRDSLAADEKFMMMLKEKCQMTNKEWDERTQTRQLEMEAVSKALSILSADDAHDLFTRTFSPALVQEESSQVSALRTEASKVLLVASNKLHNPALSTLAYKVRLDAFTRVKKAIDDMAEQLLREKADEIKHRDFCVQKLNSKDLESERKDRQKADIVSKINDLELTIQTLSTEIEALKAQMAEMQVQLKRAGENRERENQEFQAAVADQRETQKMLHAALNVLSEFYGKQEASAFVQSEDPAGPPPPAGFEAYKKNVRSGGVMGMLEQIISDAKAMEAETIRSEEDAQKAYEDFTKETNASVETKSKDLLNKKDLKAKAEGDLVEASETREALMLEIEQLTNSIAQLHKSCDFVLKNFELRQRSRDEEVEALRQAKAILSGAKFENFLQSK